MHRQLYQKWKGFELNEWRHCHWFSFDCSVLNGWLSLGPKSKPKYLHNDTCTKQNGLGYQIHELRPTWIQSWLRGFFSPLNLDPSKYLMNRFSSPRTKQPTTFTVPLSQRAFTAPLSQRAFLFCIEYIEIHSEMSWIIKKVRVEGYKVASNVDATLIFLGFELLKWLWFSSFLDLLSLGGRLFDDFLFFFFFLGIRISMNSIAWNGLTENVFLGKLVLTLGKMSGYFQTGDGWKRLGWGQSCSTDYQKYVAEINSFWN